MNKKKLETNHARLLIAWVFMKACGIIPEVEGSCLNSLCGAIVGECEKSEIRGLSIHAETLCLKQETYFT